jgi:hypothetical protein
MHVTYWNHGGRHQVAVVMCPAILGQRLAHLSQDSPDAWVLRDFITGVMIRKTPWDSTATSRLMLSQIEAEVTHCEEPLFVPVSEVEHWKRHLESRTRELLHRQPDTMSPNPEFGRWGPIR